MSTGMTRLPLEIVSAFRYIDQQDDFGLMTKSVLKGIIGKVAEAALRDVEDSLDQRDERSAGAATLDEYREALARCVEALGFVAVNVSWHNVQPGVESMVIEALYPARAILEGTDR